MEMGVLFTLLIMLATIRQIRGYGYQDHQCRAPSNLEKKNCLDKTFCLEPESDSYSWPDSIFREYGFRRVDADCGRFPCLNIQVDFDPLGKDFNNLCFNEPVCSKTQCKRRFLRIDLQVKPRCSGSVFGLIDYYSYSGQGIGAFAKGVQGLPLYGLFYNTRKQGCCFSSFSKGFWPKVFEIGTQKIRLYIAHNYIRAITDKGFDRFLCDECLFNLNNYGYDSDHKQILNLLINYADPYPPSRCVEKVCLKWETCTCDSAFRYSKPHHHSLVS